MVAKDFSEFVKQGGKTPSLASNGHWKSLLRQLDLLMSCGFQPQLSPCSFNRQRSGRWRCACLCRNGDAHCGFLNARSKPQHYHAHKESEQRRDPRWRRVSDAWGLPTWTLQPITKRRARRERVLYSSSNCGRISVPRLKKSDLKARVVSLTTDCSPRRFPSPLASLGCQEPTLQALFDLPQAFCGVTAGPGASRCFAHGS